MNFITIVLLLSSVIAGALIVKIFKIRNTKSIRLLLTFSGAYLIAVCFLHLIPELFHHNPNNNIGLFMLLGFLIQILLEFFSQGIEHGHFHKNKIIPFSVFFSLCLHAFLEGIPLGGHMHQHIHNSLLYGIVLHKIPVAIVLMTFFQQSTMRESRAIILILIFAFMSPLGVYTAKYSSALSFFQDEIMAIVIGMFIHISTTILFEKNKGHDFSLSKIITIIIAGSLTLISL